MLPVKLELEVVTPQRHVLHESVNSVELPGRDGYLGILPGHAPLITELGIGVLVHHTGVEVHYITLVHGYAEVLPDRVIVLAEISERAEEVDVARAKAALDRARERLAKPGDPEVDWNRARLALERSLIRLQAVTKGGLGAAGVESRQTAP